MHYSSGMALIGSHKLNKKKKFGGIPSFAPAEEGQPRRLRREVVLLTEDRNLRVKALARDVPVREVPDFMQWAVLG